METFQPSLLVSSRCGSLAACPTPSCTTMWRQDSLRSHQSSLSGRFCPNAPANMFTLLLHKNLLRTLTVSKMLELRDEHRHWTKPLRVWEQQVFVVFVSVLANVINVRRDTSPRTCSSPSVFILTVIAATGFLLLESETVWSYTRMTRAKRMIRSRAPLNVLVVLFFLSILRLAATRQVWRRLELTCRRVSSP